MSVGVCSDVGRVRRVNEDAAFADEPVFAVADGMGGHAAGDVASRLARDHLARLSRHDAVTAADVVAAVHAASEAIRQEGAARGLVNGMGTTVAGLRRLDTPVGSRWLVFNVGDSRVYHWYGQRLELLTRDHSEVGELVAAGHLTAAEARVHPFRNVITRSLGSDSPPDPDIWQHDVVAGERFLICSDGLTNDLEHGAIAEVMSRGLAPQTTPDQLVQRAVTSGGRDNVTAIVVEVASQPSHDDFPTHPRLPTFRDDWHASRNITDEGR